MTATWREIPEAPVDGPSPLARVAAAAAPFAVAVVLWVLGLAVAAAVVVALGVVLLGARWVWPALGHGIEQALAAFGHLVGRGLSLLLLGLVDLVVFLPLSVLAWVLRRNVLAERGAGPVGRWSTRLDAEDVVPRRPFAAERQPPRRVVHVAYLGVRIVGWVVIVAVVNYGVGWLWDEWFGSHEPPGTVAVSRRAVDDLASSPAMADSAWAGGYWEEFQHLRYGFHPYVLSRVEPTAGRYITTAGAVRRSYETVDAASDVPEVWFFGGAAMWGEGQRDDHTIASEVARLADAAGRPIRVVNFGQPGYTSWQSALLLEQELAVRHAPDLVVFYDGADDVAVQLENPSSDPTHYNVAGVTELLVGPDSAREQLQDWWASYRRTSVVNRLLERLHGVVGTQAAGADEPGLADRVAEIHARAVDLAGFAASEHQVPILFTWQAADRVEGDGGAYREVAGREVPDAGTVVDLSGVLDGAPEPVFLDGVLSNEKGAATVAGHLWTLVEPRLP